MGIDKLWKQICGAAVLVALSAAPSLALDAKTIRDIGRAETMAKLIELADGVTKTAATRQPKDFEEGTQIAAETNSYLLYIITRQNALLLQATLVPSE